MFNASLARFPAAHLGGGVEDGWLAGWLANHSKYFSEFMHAPWDEGGGKENSAKRQEVSGWLVPTMGKLAPYPTQNEPIEDS